MFVRKRGEIQDVLKMPDWFKYDIDDLDLDLIKKLLQIQNIKQQKIFILLTP